MLSSRPGAWYQEDVVKKFLYRLFEPVRLLSSLATTLTRAWPDGPAEPRDVCQSDRWGTSDLDAFF
jgi:hypothetical protein